VAAQTRTLAFSTQPIVEQAAVFGSDERSPVPLQYRSLKDRIGLLLNTRTRAVCTAFCVGPDIIATAGHCLYPSGVQRLPRLSDFLFALNYEARRGLTRLAGAGEGTAPQFVLSGGLSLSVRPPIEAAKDWAMIRLAQPVCKGTFPVRAMPADQVIAEAAAGRVFQLAYHRDYQPYRLAYSKPCAIERNYPDADWTIISKDFADPGHILLHTCDTGGSSSGSPLLLDTPTGPEVVGINVGTYEQSKVEMEDGKIVRRGKSEKVANTAVSALAFGPKLDVLKQAVILASPAQIRALQQALKQRGTYLGVVDGQFTSSLRTAIESYERAQGLPVTGLATQALLKRLTASLSKVPGRVSG
jgi:protease YdgD